MPRENHLKKESLKMEVLTKRLLTKALTTSQRHKMKNKKRVIVKLKTT